MKILIINQHTSNHGDEAAGKALIRGLMTLKSDISLGVLYNAGKLTENDKFAVDKKIEHFGPPETSFRDKILLILTFLLPFNIIRKFYFLGTLVNFEYNLLNRFDKIISAPGGVNIGPYKDWKYIWRLYVALKLNKPLAIYSISFGPMPKGYLFRKISEYILSNASFLSLRDSKSQQYATELDINYLRSIDTAFLNNQPEIDINNGFDFSRLKNYVVIVPNDLHAWHPEFKKINRSVFDEIYLRIINYFLDKKINVVLLPQLFGSQNDRKYFDFLNKTTNNRLEIIDEKYSSDVQQKIIQNAMFLIGARYHTVIFSVNNKRPFVSLAYEHKMTNTLDQLDLSLCNVNILDILTNEVDILKLIDERFNNRKETEVKVELASKKATAIATSTLEMLEKNFLAICLKSD